MIYQISPITNPVVTGISGQNPEKAPEIFAKFFAALVGVMLTAGSIWAFVNLLQGGLEWISSGGDKAALEGAQKRITNAIVGLFILFASWGLYVVVLQFLGISPLGGGGGFQIKLPTLF